jgi:photosystem II stability/assembly factor-like uncharacterized protein
MRPGIGIVAVVLGCAMSAHVPVPTVTATQIRPIDLQPGAALAWRPIGPFSAGPVSAIAGDPSRHGVFYAGASGAGLWKTIDFGATWQPVFDAPPMGAITSIAIAPSAPDVIVVATEAGPIGRDRGSALYRSTDAGATWAPVGLPTRQRLSHVAVDPSNPLRLFATVEATTTPDETYGIFLSADAGVTFERVLRTSGDDVGPGVFFNARQPSHVLAIGHPAGAAPATTTTLLHSSDGGATWQPALGLPAIGARDLQADAATAADGSWLLLMASSAGATLHRSGDGGASWAPVDTVLPDAVRAPARPRLTVASDGRLLVAAGALFESADQGRSFTRSAMPGGQHVANVWPHPTLAGVMLLAGRTGASVTVNGGRTWSAPRALPTAVVTRVSVDTAFPYRVCATADHTVSCGATYAAGEATGAERWQALPPHVTGPVVIDPLEPDFVFGGAGLKYDRRTGQAISVEPAAPPGRPTTRAIPMVFSADGRTLYAGANQVWRTTTGGQAWTAISPDLSAATSADRSGIAALTVSPIDGRTLWVGLDDGRVYITRDAGSLWAEAQRPDASRRAGVRWLEPSRFDTNSAYVVLTYEDDEPGTDGPRLLRTRDGGTTWIDVGSSLQPAGAIHVVREDPFRRGLLFAGTDRSVFISFDDGEEWQPLRLNLPATPVRDLVIKDADIIAGTAGRGVWVLDDISALRQVTADVLRANLFLFRPAQAWRERASAPQAAGADTRGAMLTYVLGTAAQDEVTLEVIETATGDVIRRFSSRPAAGPGSDGSAPLPIDPGMHRVFWDLRYQPPVPGVAGATPGTTVLAGSYQVRLTVDGRSVRQAISVRMDPRIRTSVVDLTAQRDLGRALDAARAAVHAARQDVPARAAAPDSPANAGLAGLADELEQLAAVLQQADVRPTERLEAAIEAAIERSVVALGGGAR